MEKIAIACDHAGLEMKAELSELLSSLGYEVLDLGTDGPASVDYPDFADKMAEVLAGDDVEKGVLVCGTGIGISIAANRYKHVRAALCHSVTEAKLTRQHNDANVLALGARTMGMESALDCLRAFLTTEFEGGRHSRRVGKMS